MQKYLILFIYRKSAEKLISYSEFIDNHDHAEAVFLWTCGIFCPDICIICICISMVYPTLKAIYFSVES